MATRWHPKYVGSLKKTHAAWCLLHEKFVSSGNVPYFKMHYFVYSQLRDFYKVARRYHMTKKKDVKKFQWQGYANVDIPRNHEVKVEEYVADGQQVWFDVVAALQGDYQLKLSYDIETATYRATLICHDSESDNYGRALTGWAQDAFTSIAVVHYKHERLAKHKWGASRQKSDTKFG